MTEEDAFLRTLQDDPADLQTMLVYSDWLEEHGDLTRAAFLRLQVRLVPLRHGQRGLPTWSKRLYQLGTDLPVEWLGVVSRPRLSASCWECKDDPDGQCIYRFLEGGVLNYTQRRTTYQNGTWYQIGNRVFMETNDHYADFEGVIAADGIRGTASNICGRKWKWQAQLTTNPKHRRFSNPDTTIYQHDGRTRRQRRRRS